MLSCFAKEVDKGFLKENYKFLNIALGAAKFQAFRGEGQKKRCTSKFLLNSTMICIVKSGVWNSYLSGLNHFSLHNVVLVKNMTALLK